MNQKQFRDTLLAYASSYYAGTPDITDEEWDELYREYSGLYPDDPLIGSRPADAKPLPILMASLNKLTDFESLVSWISDMCSIAGMDILFNILPKYDGGSICVDENSSPSLRSAWTRGDGVYGSDISSQYMFINNNDDAVARPMITFGETIMSRAKFRKYDKDNGGMYKNARNLVTSQMRPTTDTNSSALPDISYIRYGVFRWMEGWGYCPSEFEARAEELDYLNQLFNTGCEVPYKTVGSMYFSMPDCEKQLRDLFYEWSQEWEIDGLVVEIDNAALRARLGRETNGNPAYARAYKNNFEDIEITSVHESKPFNWQVSKDYKLKPTVNIDPVRLNGVDVSKATVYNARWIMDTGIGAGSVIEIKRSGAVIPKVIRVHNGHDYNEEPLLRECPACGGEVRFDGVDYRCGSVGCSGRGVSILTFFFETMKCAGVGRGTMESLYAAGMHSVAEVLAASPAQISEALGYAVKDTVGLKPRKIYAAIHSCLDGVKIEDVMHASNLFSGIGSDTIQIFMDKTGGEFRSVDNDSHDAGVFNTGVEAFVMFLGGIRDYIRISGRDTAKTSRLAGINAVFTGFRDKYLEGLLSENGGKVSGSVTRSVTHLVVRMRGSGTTKEQAAIKAGIPIMTAAEFTEFIGQKL